MDQDLISDKGSLDLSGPDLLRRHGLAPSLHDHPVLLMASLAIMAGILGGGAAIALRWLLATFHGFFFGAITPTDSILNPLLVVLLPAVGALVAGLLVDRAAVEATGAGVSHLLQAVLLNGSRVRPRVAGVKVVATALVIGSGGSAGVVGPMVQVGGTIGSALGQRLGLSEERLRALLAAGAAAGVGGIINAPLAGVFFAQEVILKKVGVAAITLAALAAGTGSLAARTVLGSGPMLGGFRYTVTHPVELILYLSVGILAAVVAITFIHGLGEAESLFSRLRLPLYWRTAIGGLAVGVIALLFPQVRGLGYETIEAVLRDQLPLTLVGALVVAKLAATSLTVGSGSSGGVVGPSLFLGAVLGGGLGVLFHAVLPGVAFNPGAYALVGMAAVLAATFRAPATAIAIGLELTGDFELALPLILACTGSRYLAQRISPHAIYSITRHSPLE